jgi:hypothetical protein
MTYREDRTSDALDAALEMTFPASDPIAVSGYENKPARAERASSHRERLDAACARRKRALLE